MLKSSIEVVKRLVVRVIDFANTKGFTALVALGLGSISLLSGYPFMGGIGFGVFFSKNTQIIKDLLKEYEII